MRLQIYLIVWGLLTTNIATAQQLEPFGLQGKNVTAMQFYGGSLYAATANDGVYRRYWGVSDSNWVHLGVPAKNLTSIFAFHTFCPLICWKGILVGATLNPAGGDSALLYFYQQRPDTCTKKGRWTAADSGIDRSAIVQINALAGIDVCHPVAPTYVTAFASTAGSLWRSEDRGKSWKQIFQTPSANIYALAASPRQSLLRFDDEVWAGGYTRNSSGAIQALILHSADSGEHWEDRSPMTPIISEICWALALHPTDTNTVYAASNHTIMKTRDGGRTWSFTPFAEFAVNFRALAVNPLQPNHILAGGIAGDILIFTLLESVDAGENWREVPAPNELNYVRSGINSLVFNPSDSQYVYIATQAGVYRYAGLKVGVDEKSPAPTSFQLSANFPNPLYLTASTSLTFRVNVPAADFLTVRLFNIAGQELASWKINLNAGEQNLVLPFDSTKLAGGIYFIQANWRGQWVTQKWTVVR